ncbi:MAG TPA: YtxH domain-containing protein [Longimicrobiales bacterium]|jgi:gas vesicle protein
MYYDDRTRLLNFVAGLALGAVLGAGVALLLAPESGRRTRRRLWKAVAGARENVSERWDDLSEEIRSAVESGRRRLRR